jgi:hypothetical protein
MSEKSLADFSVAGGTYPKYEQQTFLGASLSSFTVNAGFGDTSSTLGVQLVEDEYNISDGSGLGRGQDVYHNGVKDQFIPPPVGSPVFFSFGARRATVQDAYLKPYDDLYGKNASVNNPARDHFTFGGILQTYTQNKNPAGSPMYSVQVVDPREILSNVQLILNNYAGSTYGGQNMLNIFGFLEFNSAKYEGLFSGSNAYPLKKFKNTDGSYVFQGTDMYYVGGIPNASTVYQDSVKFEFDAWAVGDLPRKFPITGTGRSRRCPQGIPYYRIVQAINAMSGFDGELPDEYKAAGFGGYINFRGMNYVVDLTGLPTLPQFYFLDYDQINVLDLCLEICEVLNWELFVTLLPIINHPACKPLYDYNEKKIKEDKPKEIIAGIIKINAIDKSSPPSLTAIKSYIDRLTLPIENRDVGYELANTVTDKFIVGAQEVNMHYFTTNTDRNKITSRSSNPQWTLEASYAQQILPYYGMLSNRAVTIPKGFGSYQQILLDSTTLQAHGVGNYYVATEMELRAASISFERWSEFLMMYNDIYMESVEGNDIRDIASLTSTANTSVDTTFGLNIPIEISDNYAVTVPRSVWTTDQEGYDIDGLPLSACNPPYGYPLYYKRATQIGLPQAGLANLAAIGTKMFTQLTALRNTGTDNEFKGLLNSIFKEIDNNYANKSIAEREFYDFIKLSKNGNKNVAFIEKMLNQLGPIVAGSQRIAKKNNQNAQRVYNFLKNIADECLGKKFLVKLPKKVNPNYSTTIKTDGTGSSLEIRGGPFGFVRRSISNNPLDLVTADDLPPSSGMNSYQLSSGPDPYYGALKTNYNPITEQYEFNYTPDNQGGYYPFDLLSSYGGTNYGVNYGLIPLDATNFVNENSRISAYVRFDHSEQLSFDSISKDSFVQQTISANHFVPDISYQLENSTRSSDKFEPSDAELSRPQSVAFIKCDVSETLYMPPKSSTRFIKVHGREVDFTVSFSPPNKIFDPITCTSKDSYRYFQRHYKPLAGNPDFTSEVRIFDIVSVTLATTTPEPNFVTTTLPPSRGSGTAVLPNFPLDADNVYALITLPNRIVPTATSRYRDSLKEKVYPANLKHFLLLDTVRDVPGFDLPSLPTFEERDIYSRLSPEGLGSDAEAAITKTFEGLTFSLPNKITAASPSPVYPDLVALPLRSSERCYGPWLSSYISSEQVGGKLEFVKDENLAPWNYNGFDLMDAVGKMHASFGTSAMLVSERGGFVVPAAPSGVALARSLGDAGPLVTNISVDVSQAGIKTTYKMDLYTASFGKMQKQKLDNISNISRNRQKQRDEKNALVRKGIGKNQTNINYQQLYKNMENSMRFDDQNTDIITGGLASQPADTSVLSVITQAVGSFIVSAGASISDGIAGITSNRSVEASMMSSNLLGQGIDFMSHNAQSFGRKHYNTAASNLSEDKAPASYEDHPNMSVVGRNYIDMVQEMNSDDDTDLDRLSSWR